jgi:hypothetical protein
MKGQEMDLRDQGRDRGCALDASSLPRDGPHCRQVRTPQAGRHECARSSLSLAREGSAWSVRVFMDSDLPASYLDE